MTKNRSTQKLGALARALAGEGFTVHQGVAVGSSTADAVVTTRAGPLALMELKAWEPSPAGVRRAREYARALRAASGADEAYVFLPGLGRNLPASGVFSADDPTAFVEYFATRTRPKRARRRPTIRSTPAQSVFVAMPFAAKYDDTYLVAIQPAALAAGALPIRIDHHQFTGDIVREIKAQIRRSRAVVADLSEARPNVLFELGLADALGRPVIQVSSSPLEQLPFDVRNNKTIAYTMGQTSSLRPKLVRALSAALR